ncbi:MAG: hypothetical protein M1834_003883 [Cirrosporium novae-zelandiae]|nr:MAG: hypothetical protein M1834_003883 [Cirrosporium novae-zelandiae]
MASHGVPTVQVYRDFIQGLLDKLPDVSSSNNFESVVTISNLEDKLQSLKKSNPSLFHENGSAEARKQAQYAAVETAFRDIFYDLLNSRSIEDPSFDEIWKLLDIVSTFSDSEQCESGLIFWLVEELLDSQTIDGCRKVFDFLESRRERITAKHFKSKSLIILRSCNELLRRLSRAEDTVFCGRVFIFLFQSFPLGDKSSVNLRGEYHVENITTFDEPATKNRADGQAMDIDNEEKKDATNGSPPEVNQTPDNSENAAASNHSVTTPEIITPDNKNSTKPSPLDLDTLYPIFWSLQRDFSQPTRLFESQNFESFKKGIEETIIKFEALASSHEEQNSTKAYEEHTRLGKRKRTADDDAFASTFNPKYLTSRDLFELEVNDSAFRRHVLVQALIVLDFLFSLTEKGKAKIANMSNKAVIYSFTLSDEEAKWVASTKSTIASYLQRGQEGKFYYRMVDTVLSRDKNWTRWKADNCKLIERPGLSLEQFKEARDGAQKACATKRLRAMPLGSLDVRFLSETDHDHGIEHLKNPERYAIPSVTSFKGPIAEDEFDIDMAKDSEEKALAENTKASKVWRTLRVASKNKLNILDQIEDGKNLEPLFRDPVQVENEDAANIDESTMDATPVITEAQQGCGESIQADPVQDVGEGRPDSQPPATVEENVVK